MPSKPSRSRSPPDRDVTYGEQHLDTAVVTRSDAASTIDDTAVEASGPSRHCRLQAIQVARWYGRHTIASRGSRLASLVRIEHKTGHVGFRGGASTCGV
jgi:hypothetical protein